LALLKNFTELKKIDVEDRIHTTCSFVPHFPHCETSLSVFRTKEIDFPPKTGEKSGKIREKPVKNRQKPVKFSEPYPVIGTNNFY